MAGGTGSPGRVFTVRRPRARFHALWVSVLRPFHHLAPGDARFAAALLDRRAETGGKEGLLSREGRRLMAGRLGVSESAVNVHVHKLRKAGVLGEDDFKPAFLPVAGEDGCTLTIRFVFDGG